MIVELVSVVCLDFITILVETSVFGTAELLVHRFVQKTYDTLAMFRKEPPIAVRAVLLLERQGTLLAEQFALIMDKSLRHSKKVRLLLILISEPFGHFVSERIVLFCHHF